MQRTETRLTSLTKRVNKAIKNSSGKDMNDCYMKEIFIVIFFLV